MQTSMYPKLQDKRVYALKAEHMSTIVGPSETVPDDALTIKQIIQKHTQGMPIPPSKIREGAYNGGDFDSPDLESLSRLDLADKHEYAETLREQNEAKIAELKSAKIAADKAAKALKKPKAPESDGQTAGTETSKSSPTQATTTKTTKEAKED